MSTPTAIPTIVRPDEAAYDEARQAWNLAADLRPAGVAVARSADDVAAIVRHAREHGLRVAPQGTGHMAGALPDLSDVILLKTDLRPRVHVEAQSRSVRVAAGTVWSEVTGALEPFGLAALAGSAHDVGVIGYTLGGGLSWLGREYGLAANHVTAVELVTADGILVRATIDREPDLFWAVRGGGGNFGVVTAIEFEVFPIGEVFGGITIWDGGQSTDVLIRWLEWTRTAPEAVTTSARILQLPPLPDVPEPLRERPLVAIDGAVPAGEDEAVEMVRAFRGIPGPIMDTWAPMPPARLSEIHMDPPSPVPGVGHHALLDALDDAAIRAFVDAAGPGSGSPLLMAELRQLGGALGRQPAGAGAAGSLAGEYLLFGVGMAMDAASAAAITAHLDGLVAAMGPYGNGRQYINFGERGGSAAPAYAPDTYTALQEIRRRRDPQELFVGSHRIAGSG